MKLKYYLLLFVLSVFICPLARAQSVAFGFLGGVSSRNFTNGGDVPSVVTSRAHFVLAPNAALFTELQFSNNFSIQPMIEYSAEGNKGAAFSTGAPTASSLPDANVNRAELNYLLVPVLAKFGWNFESAPLRFYVAGGPFAGFLLGAQQTVYDNTPDNGHDVKSQLNQFNAGLEGKLGLMLNSNNGSFFIEGGGNYGVMKIQKATNVAGNKTGSLMIDIGYSYWLGTDSRRSSGNMRM